MKKFRKGLSVFLSALLIAAITAGCAQSAPSSSASSAPSQASSAAGSQPAAAKTTVKAAALKGPSAIGMAKLMDDAAASKTANNYAFTLVSSPDEIVSKISNGEIDIAAVPSNLGATLYNKTGGNIRMLALSGLGVLYIVTKGVTINSVQDLKGKTIVASGQGSTPEYALDMILSANGLDPSKDVTVEYKTEHAEVATQFLAGQAGIVMLPEPFVTQVLTKDATAKVALDLTKEWDKAVNGKSALTMTSIIARKDFVDTNKAAVDTFLMEYKASTEYANKNTDDTAALSEKYNIMPAAVAKKAIPNCNIVFFDGDEMKTKTVDFFNVLFKANPKSVGGKLPGEDFYYKK